ncbi:LytR C-terminal domain-containing protein [Antribacter sp. KLBMP9083]|uniref:LytR C-terminal domain-containing protein n=1 Tax=Antribacter soli TaxID=2910976 RepID=A0AA41UA27_9MICO|nr:LytR C-terminal domain-containing protein [Antribacter soli]MCF4122207.1 LytR C-terminal domain-containing protein [Antribacter soli]
MTKSTYPYPPDEFDVAVPGGAPVGVHRAPRSGWSSVWPFLLVAVICAGVAWGGITLLNGDPGAAQAETPGASASPDPSASASAPADPAASASPTPAAEPPAPTYPGDPAQANLAAVMAVYNASGQQGVAGSTVEKLQGAGFTGEIAAETAGDEMVAANPANTVLYGADRADTATAVAQALGITNLQESEDVTDSAQAVWVVIVTPIP